MLHYFFWAYSFAWVKTKHPTEKVHEVRVINPSLAGEVETLFYCIQKPFEAILKQLLLLYQYFRIISACYAEKSIVNYGSALLINDTTFETKPQREATQNFDQNAS
jgi:hypothetical protein